MQAKMQSILDDYQADLDRATEMASLRFNALVKATLDGCAVDRHQGETPLELEDAKNHRGAVAELIAEACALVNFYNESERRVGLMCDDYTPTKVA